MRKGIIQKLTMLAFVAMVGIPAFAQGGKFGTNAGVATTVGEGVEVGQVFDYQELRYYVQKEEGGIFQLEVIGLASYIAGATGDPEILTRSDLGTGVTIVPNTVMIPLKMPAESGINGEVVSIAANAFTSTVLYQDAKDQTADSKDQFADAAALVTNLVIEYSAEATAAADIGENAFAGLKALTEVKNLTPGNKIWEIPYSSFFSSVYDNAILVVPSGNANMGLYKAKAGWENFYDLKTTTSSSIFLDINGDGIVDGKDLLDFEDAMVFEDYTGMNEESLDVNGDGVIDGKDLLALEDYSIFR